MPDPAHAPARRYAWLRGWRAFAVLALVLVTALGTAWALWRVGAQRRLDAVVGGVEARGEPIHLSDFEPGTAHRPTLANADNAAYHLRQAEANWPRIDGGVLITETDWFTYSSTRNDEERPPDPITDNRAYLDSLAPAIDSLRRAAAAPAAEWDVVLGKTALETLLPHLGWRRKVVRLIADAAERALDLGDTRLALELMRLTLQTAPATNGPPPTLIGHLVYISINAMVFEPLEGSLPRMVIPADATDPTRREAEALLAWLSDDGPLRESHIQAFVGERMTVHDTGLAVADGRLEGDAFVLEVIYNLPPWAAGPLRLGISPLILHDTAFMVEYLNTLRDAAESADTEPQMQAAITSAYPGGIGAELDAHPYRHLVSRTFLAAYDASIRTHFQELARQRLAAAALAIKLYEADRGRRPGRLAELVPDYLPAVPMDPWDPAAGPIRYLPTGGALMWPLPENGTPKLILPAGGDGSPAVVYSLGLNGIDDGGAVYVDPDTSEYFDVARYRDGTDHVFLLDPVPAGEARP